MNVVKWLYDVTMGHGILSVVFFYIGQWELIFWIFENSTIGVNQKKIVWLLLFSFEGLSDKQHMVSV